MSKWVVLGKPECPWCTKVETLLHDHDIEFVYMNVLGTDLYQFMINCGLLTVPQVYRDGSLVGGYEDTEAYLSEMYNRDF